MITKEHVFQVISKINKKDYFYDAKEAYDKHGYSGLYIQAKIVLGKIASLQNKSALYIKAILQGFCEQEKAISSQGRNIKDFYRCHSYLYR